MQAVEEPVAAVLAGLPERHGSPRAAGVVQPVILSGGSGSRLWPVSRAAFPKQLLPLLSERTMLQETILRLEHLPAALAPVIVCAEAHRFFVAEQSLETGVTPAAILLEPYARNTAAAVAAAALYVKSTGEDPLLLVLPADHAISDPEAFGQAVAGAVPAADAGGIVLFGVTPAYPATGYGYIVPGAPLSGGPARSVSRFVEKPAVELAGELIESAGALWNSGIFLMRASTYLAELERAAPEIAHACGASVEESFADLDFLRLGAGPMAGCPSLSLDVSVMETTRLAAVFPASFSWSDVGSWDAIRELQECDADGNASRGRVMMRDTRNCYVHGDTRLVATIGVEDLIVVDTPDALLVARADQTEHVRELVDLLHRRGAGEYREHRRVHRPWGSYESMDRGERFQVKRLIVKPGATLSLQKHYHRSEHWVVVSGTIEVRIGDAVQTVNENQSVYVPAGEIHRIHNPGRIAAHVVEVQTGSYLGEDDIVRTEDVYGR
jgi:mannose-1-phosphate guanylyltransferase/mannose-6-phosphate isomerase